MQRLNIVLIIFFSTTLFQCGGSDMEEGDAQYKQENYVQALNNYLAYKKSNPQDETVNPKIALTYVQRGKEIYNTRRNIEAFAGNYEKAQNFMQNGFETAEHKNEYSSLLFDFALAYRNTKPQNEIQKEQFFNNTLDYLNLAIENNPDNVKADSLLTYIYDENYQMMYDKGFKFLNQAKKEKNNADLYLSAERYLSRAVVFNPVSEEARKNLSDVRKQTLGILQAANPFSFCVPAYKKSKDVIFVDLAAQNFDVNPFIIDLSKFEVTSVNGEIFKIDLKKTAELEKALVDKSSLQPRKRIDGQVIFAAKPGIELESIVYLLDDVAGLLKNTFPKK